MYRAYSQVLYEARADIRRVTGCIATGTAYFADAAAAGPRTSPVATCALRPPRAATFQRLGSGGSPLGAPHRGRLRCRLSRAWLFRRCLARRAAPLHGRRGRCGGQPRHWGGPGGCRAALCRGGSPVSAHPRTRGTKKAAAMGPRSRRGAEALWQPAARCAPLGVCGDGSAGCAGGRGCRGVLGASFAGRRPCRTSGRGCGRCGWAVCEPLKRLTAVAACAAQGPRRAVREARGLRGARVVSAERGWAFEDAGGCVRCDSAALLAVGGAGRVGGDM
eukprot:SAG25_NODE_571_length_6846_cov_4.575070_4_plen_276_part_00